MADEQANDQQIPEPQDETQDDVTPAADGGPEGLQLKKPVLKLKPSAPTAPATHSVPPGLGEDDGGGEGVSDPLSMRDTQTSNLQRVEPQDEPDAASTIPATPAADDSEGPGPDTVRLKVIREKKKQLANILTASQTIHLRPTSEGGPAASDGAEAPPGAGGPAAPPPAKDTLKLNVPGAVQDEAGGEEEDSVHTSTLKIRPRGSIAPGGPTLGGPSPATVVGAEKKASATLKIKPPTAGGSAGTVAVQPPTPGGAPPAAPAPGAAPAAAATQQAEPPQASDQTAKLTLKIKPGLKPKQAAAGATVSLPGVGEDQAEGGSSKAGKTVALTPPPSGAQATVEVKPEDAAAAAAEETAPAAKSGKKTLKLRTDKPAPGLSPSAAAGPPSRAGVASEEAGMAPPDMEGNAPVGADEPGVGYTVASFITLAAVVAMCILLVQQFIMHAQ